RRSVQAPHRHPPSQSFLRPGARSRALSLPAPGAGPAMTAPATPAPARRVTLHAQFVRRLLWPLVIAFALAASITALVGYHAGKRHEAAHRAQTLAAFARSLVKPLWDCDGT